MNLNDFFTPQVAKMHIAMESIGKRPEPQPPKEKEKEKEKDKPRKHRGQTSMGRAGTATANNTDRDETGPSASDTDHAGSGRDSRGAKTTDPSTITIDSGEHFAQRKEAIQNIMKKVIIVYCLDMLLNNICFPQAV